jgi:hypothetical protein
MRGLLAYDELRQLLATTAQCAAQVRAARKQAEKYADHYRVNADEFRQTAARCRFPEIRERLLRIAASNERLAESVEAAYGLPKGRPETILVSQSSPPNWRMTAEAEEPVRYRPLEDPVAQARRHVAEAEGRIARQEALVARLLLDNKHAALADQGKEILATLKHTLSLAREHLALELRK